MSVASSMVLVFLMLTLVWVDSVSGLFTPAEGRQEFLPGLGVVLGT